MAMAEVKTWTWKALRVGETSAEPEAEVKAEPEAKANSKTATTKAN